MNQTFWTAVGAIATLAGAIAAIWVALAPSNSSNISGQKPPEIQITLPSDKSKQQDICKSATISTCRNDIRINAQAAVISCQGYVDCDQNNPAAFALLGQANRVVGRLAAAEKSYEQQLMLGQKNNDESVVAQAYHNLSVIYLEQNALDRAESVFKKSLELNLKSENKAGQGANYKGLADVYLKRGNLPTAENYFLKSSDILTKIDDKIGIGNTYVGLGFTKLRAGERTAGCSYLQQARKIFEETKYPRGVGEVDNYLQRTGCR